MNWRNLCVGCFLSIALSRGAESRNLIRQGDLGPFLGGHVPSNAPPHETEWQAVVAFPHLRFTNALGIAAIPGSARLVVWEREGRVYSFSNNAAVATKSLVLDISHQCQGWDDSGLLALAFHPGFETNHFLFVYYTWVVPGTVVGNPTNRPPPFKEGAYHDRLSRFTLDDSGVAFPESELVLVDQVGNSLWHGGGGLFFGPNDGFLYFANGDDGNGPTQVIDQDLFSGVFRIDVDQRGGTVSHPPPRQPLHGRTGNYFIPNDNPFVGKPNVLEEFFALGLRNPHRMTVDPPTGRIFIGDVGAESREEIDVIDPKDPPGLNFQWNKVEGVRGDLTPPYIGVNRRPLLDYDRADGQAVIGGYVYRGREFERELGGKYVFGDNVQRKIWALERNGSKTLLCILPKGSGPSSGPDYTGLSSFGIDAESELYLCQMSSEGGLIYRLAHPGMPKETKDFPRLLSETGAFSDLKSLVPAPGLIAYDVNSPLWSDGARKLRWMAVPSRERIVFRLNGEWEFPAGTVFVKHFEIPIAETRVRRLETRFLVRAASGGVFGATYKWRSDQTDAELLRDRLDEEITVRDGAGERKQVWHYPNREECLQCHSSAAQGVLGVNTRQCNREFQDSGGARGENQVLAWKNEGLFVHAPDDEEFSRMPRLQNISNERAPLEARVRSYLDSNCSHCHRPNGVNAKWDARFEVSLEKTGLIDGPVNQNFGDKSARVVAPGRREQSVLLKRLAAVEDPLRMPPLAKNAVDQTAVDVLTEWIRSLK